MGDLGMDGLGMDGLGIFSQYLVDAHKQQLGRHSTHRSPGTERELKACLRDSSRSLNVQKSIGGRRRRASRTCKHSPYSRELSYQL